MMRAFGSVRRVTSGNPESAELAAINQSYKAAQRNYSHLAQLIEHLPIGYLRINILRAEIEAGRSGSLLVELTGEEPMVREGVAYLERNGVTVSPVASKIAYDRDRCIDCGNCALACFPQALTIGAPDWRLHFDPERCIACKLCLKSCPLGLFHIEFTEA